MKPEKYTMSFSTGGLFIRESVLLAELYLQLKDWKLVRQKISAVNVLQTRTLSSAKRSGQEIVKRLEKLNSNELATLVESDYKNQGYLLWIAVCRRYRFIKEFATEVVRERYISLKHDLSYDDYESFYFRKAEQHDELDKIKPATQEKLRQVLFKILREADLLSESNTINPPVLSAQLLDILWIGNRRELMYFPVFDITLKGRMQ